MQVKSLDHLVLTVRDITATCLFYERILGMKLVTFGEGRTALSFGSQKINLHELGNEFEPKAARPTAGSADLCFIAELPIEAIVEHLKNERVPIVDGPVRRSGAMGPMHSVYVRDPDGNLIELSVYEGN
jgi:catechol 2,3-dioxygenase-like lactoylglutathione lyase family enzyme